MALDWHNLECFSVVDFVPNSGPMIHAILMLSIYIVYRVGLSGKTQECLT